MYYYLPLRIPGQASSPRNTIGTSTFITASGGARMKVAFNIASVPACKWTWEKEMKQLSDSGNRENQASAHDLIS